MIGAFRGLLGRVETVPFVRGAEGPKLLIFDFDGTIADTFETGFEIFNDIAAELGCRQIDRSEIPLLRTMRTLQLMRFLNVPIARMGFIARRGCEELSARIDGIKPFPGVPEALRELRARGHRLGIITSNSDSNVRRFLQNHNLEVFEFIRSSSKIMGKAGEIRATLRSFQLDPSEVLLVGDETRDVEAAQAARVPIAAICWGYSTRGTLEAMKPSLLLNDLEELLQVLGRGNGQWEPVLGAKASA